MKEFNAEEIQIETVTAICVLYHMPTFLISGKEPGMQPALIAGNKHLIKRT